jgi:tetrahydromethanopterin S-methyltransferase subunit G
MVSAMRCGKPLVIVCGDEFPDFHERYKIDEKYGITWSEILQWEPFRNKE